MLICVLGLPGTGKSTLCRRLEVGLKHAGEGEKTSGMTYLHPGRYAYAMGWAPRYASRAQLAAIPQLNEKFMAALSQAVANGDVVCDGFPRTQAQAELLLTAGLHVVVVNLIFPQNSEVEHSIARQEKRIKDDGVVVPRSEVEEQTNFALAVDRPATDIMLASGCPVITVDALLSEADVEDNVLRALASASVPQYK